MKKTAWLVLFGFLVLGCSNTKDPGLSELPGEWSYGAEYLGADLGTRFVLYAPGAKMVEVRGSFTNWAKNPVVMETDGKGHFFTRVTQAKPGDEYKYYSPDFVNNWVNDPYSRLLSPGDENGVILGGSGLWSTDFLWTNQNFQRPEREDLVIYEMHVIDFTRNTTDVPLNHQESLAGILDRLPYLLDLGVNAVEFMPITEWPGGYYSWGYNPWLYFALENSLATQNSSGAQVIRDLKNVVNTLHNNGIAVILDVVYNHTTGDAPLHEINPTVFYKDNPTPWGPALDETNPWVKQHIMDSLLYWIEEFHIDGFRFDYTEGMDIKTLFEIVEAIESRGHKKIYWIFEEFGWFNNQQIQGYNANRNRAVISSWGTGYKNRIWNALDNGSTTNLGVPTYFSQDNGWGYPGSVINYISSHDEGTLIAKHVSGTPRYTEAQVRLGFTHLFTSLGVPMIWMGDEIGNIHYGNEHPLGPGYNVDKNENEVNWVAGTSGAGKKMFDFMKGLIDLRLGSPALRIGNSDPAGSGVFDWVLTPGNWSVPMASVDPGERAIGYALNSRRALPGPQFLVLLNYGYLDNGPWEIPFPENGDWKLVVDSVHSGTGIVDKTGITSLVVSGGKAEVSLSPHQALVYMKD